ncbi:MAG: class I SAM-dependent methyltransferase, partial [Lentisphaerae bacterium]|nr:class I SAM-dependent methyltransferase [Lentisphaerota bacterium]
MAIGNCITRPLRRLSKSILDRLLTPRLAPLYLRADKRLALLIDIAEYLEVAEVQGEYAEFGVWKGRTFLHAYRFLADKNPAMLFYALDSWEGLPEPAGKDAEDGYCGGFVKGQYKGNLAEFWQMVDSNKLDRDRIRTVQGWFDETLKPGNPDSSALEKVAVAWVDCDLYESTVPVLEFLTHRLDTGAVVVFDCWRCFRNLPDRGQQLACAEWLQRNPDITLRHLMDFMWGGT